MRAYPYANLERAHRRVGDGAVVCDSEGMPHALQIREYELWLACDGLTSTVQLAADHGLSEIELASILGRLSDLELLWPNQMPRLKPELTAVRVGDDTLVYDPNKKVAHHLGQLESRVLGYCDGQTRPEEVAAHLTHPDPEGLLELTLSELSDRGLLDRPVASQTSRREFLARWGKAAAALPVIASLAVPTPAAAASCVPSGGTCGSVSDCCVGASTPFCATIGVTAFRCCTGIAQACNPGDLCCGSDPGSSSALERVCCPGGTTNQGKCGLLNGGCCASGSPNIVCCSNSCLGPQDSVNCPVFATGTCN